jgi:hypothetical protein
MPVVMCSGPIVLGVRIERSDGMAEWSAILERDSTARVGKTQNQKNSDIVFGLFMI